MSHSSRVAVIDLVAAAGTTVNAPLASEDNIPVDNAGTSTPLVRVIDSVVAYMQDDGTGATTAVVIQTNAGLAPLLTLGKTFAANEGDTFIVHFPRGLPVYDTVAGTDTGTYKGAARPQTSAVINKLTINVPSGLSAGYLTIAYHWAHPSQLG